MIPHATIEHQLPSRTRLKIVAKRHDAQFFAQLATQLQKFPGIERIRTAPTAASIVLEHSGDFGPIAALAAGEGVLTIDPPLALQTQKPDRPSSRLVNPPRRAFGVAAWVLGALAAYQGLVARNFGYAIDNFWNAYGAKAVLQNPSFAAVLVGIGLWQFTSGRWFGSAPTLLLYAMYARRMAQERPANSPAAPLGPAPVGTGQ